MADIHNTNPNTNHGSSAANDPALRLIRDKINNLYRQEPDAISESEEVEHVSKRSKHQQFMYELNTSGKDMVQIQTEWHDYYQKLPDHEKHQVWQEFYASSRYANTASPLQTTAPDQQALQQHLSDNVQQRGITQRPKHNVAELRRIIRSRAGTKPKLTLKHHIQSALFGLGMGMIVVFILLFGFFNEVFIAPFIQPSRNNTATPIIISSSNSTVAASSTPEVIIPKINVEIPINYAVNTTNENVIENFLNDGVVHYPTTSVPGQDGNAAFFGHSSNNIFNPGKYKFAFVLLHELVPGDVFYLTYNKTVYAYKVFSTTVVNPSDVSVLNPVAGHAATATLITCDPPGTSLNRLVVVGDQISPSPNGDTAATPMQPTSTTQLPGNGPTLWSRFISTIYGKAITIAFILAILWFIYRWYIKEFRS